MKKILNKTFISILVFLSFTYSEIEEPLVVQLRKKFLTGDLSVKNLLETQEFEGNDKLLSYLTLFEIYANEKNLDKMLEIQQKIGNNYPISQLTNYILGKYYYSNKKFKESAEKLAICVSNDSRFFEARDILANTCFHNNDYLQAYKHYNILSWFDKKNKKIQKEICKLLEFPEIRQLPEPQYNKNFSQNIITTISSQTLETLRLSPAIDVGISTFDNGNIYNIHRVLLKCSTDFYVLDDKNNIVFTCNYIDEQKKEKYKKDNWEFVLKHKLNYFAIVSPLLKKEIRIKSKYLTLRPKDKFATFVVLKYTNHKKEYHHYKEYRDEIILKNYKNKLIVINRTHIDFYLYGVVAKEIGADKPPEALKTQAVTARTFAIYNKNKKIHSQFNVCNGQHCQVYTGIRSDTQTIVEAVNSTIGEIIVNPKGKPLHSFFHANCGGITHTPQGVGWTKNNSYFTNVLDILEGENFNKDTNLYYWYLIPPKLYCNTATTSHPGTSRWLRIADKKTLSKTINSKIKIGKLKEIKILERSSNHYVTKVKIIGSSRTITITGESKIRRIFFPTGLRSSSFLLEYNKNNDMYYFWGAGWGHGVGMCQDGICGLAEQGKNYINILQHYYPGVEIKKIY